VLDKPPRRGPFYGWLIVGVIFLGGVFNSGLSLWGIGIFIKPMEADLGWSRATFFAALSLRGILAGLMSPFVGPLLDSQRGPRLLLLAGSVLLGASIAALALVQEVWQFYLLFGVFGALSLIASSQSVGEVVLPKWFIRRRGRAMAISSMSTPLSGMFMPALLQVLISSFGWRDAWLILGIAGLVLLVPLALLVKTTPEEMGLLPDGDSEPPRMGSSGQVRVALNEEESLTRAQAVRTRSFWLLLLAMSLFSLHAQGFQQNWMPYFQDQGFSVATGTAAIAFYGIFSTTARLFWGLMAERVYITTLMAVGTTLTAATILILLNATTVLVLFLYIALQGMTLGGQFLLQPLAVANLFGRAHLGAIRGIMRPALTFSSAAGPLVIAALYDAQGSYHGAFIFVMVSWFASGFCYYLASRLRRRPSVPAPAPATANA
jgi:OFA family oxalate/formate antiporter-like MFS transporter